MPALRLTLTIGTVALAGVALAGPAPALASAATPAAAHKGILPPKNPSKSLAASPSFLGKCSGGRDGRPCNATILKAITHARRVLEKMGGMSFSLAAYEKLGPDDQLFVTVNLERIERGLRPAVVLTRSLDKIAQAGAKADADPNLGSVPSQLPGGGHWISLGGNWAGGMDNALGSDYGWMYYDGLNSFNADCTKTHKSGCWGHRDNILRRYATSRLCGGGRAELAMGAGHVAKGAHYGDSETELFVGVCGPIPTDRVFSWARAKALLHIK